MAISVNMTLYLEDIEKILKEHFSEKHNIGVGKLEMSICHEQNGWIEPNEHQISFELRNIEER